MSAEAHDLLVRLDELSLHADRDAPRAVPPREVEQGAQHVDEARLVVDDELEHARLLAGPALDERRGMREREAHELLALVEQDSIAEPELVREVDLTRVVIARREAVDEIEAG